MMLMCAYNLQAQDIEYITYVDNFSSSPSEEVVYPILPKSKRTSSTKAIIIKDSIDSEIPDSIRRCIKVATDLWRSCFDNNALNIVILFKYAEISNDIETSVAYNNDYVYLPMSLEKQLNTLKRDLSIPDAKIIINKNTKWDCGFADSNVAGGYNLTNALLRGIAVSLGFGSSVAEKKLRNRTVIKFNHSVGCSVFDSLLFSDNINLKDITNMGANYNKDLEDFSLGKKGPVYVLKKNDKYKMYTPSVFENSKSLICLDNKESLMDKSLCTNIKKLQIDSVTIDILNSIGWSIQAPNQNLTIKSSDIDSTGLASAYSTHHFFISEKQTDDLKNIKWMFYLPLDNGKEKLVASAENSIDFTIPLIGDDNSYMKNINGDIYGKVICTRTYLGHQLRDTYYVTLELKPHIRKVEIVEIVDHNPSLDSYDIFYNVEYSGSDELIVNVEEEYGEAIASQIIKEPYYAHIKSSNITAPYYAWIDIMVKNKYGEDSYTLELAPYGNLVKSAKQDTSILRNQRTFEYDYIEVYNINGERICQIQKNTQINSLPNGMYLFKYFLNGKIVGNKKYLK